MKKLIIYLVSIVSLGFNSYAQNDSPLPLKQVNVATPEGAMLGKFENIAISNYTGVPEISIPLYTIKMRELEIPIVINYNSSGIQVAEEATWVGLGWNLSVGGQITHIPVGADDDYELDNWSYLSRYDQLMEGDIFQFSNTYSGRAERGWVWQACVPEPQDNEDGYYTFKYVKDYGFASPDIYNYMLPTTSGKFFLMPVTYKPTLFGAIKSVDSIHKDTDKWTIVDMNGIKYLFDSGGKEISKNMDIIQDHITFSTATWKMSSIELPSGELVDFEYEEGVNMKRNYFDNFESSDNLNWINLTNSNMYRHSAKYLKKIETENVRVIFSLSDNREDLLQSTFSYDQGKLPKRLNSIYILDKLSNKIIKSIKFDYDYMESSHTPQTEEYNYKRLRLLSIQEFAFTESGILVENPPFVFEYNTTLLPIKNSKSIDHWGYFNGRNNQVYLPDLSLAASSGLFDLSMYPDKVQKLIKDNYVTTNNGASIPKANRGMDPDKAKGGLLTKITYPTGGYRLLKYEANEFTNHPVFSADEEDNGDGLFINISVTDLNKTSIGQECTSTPKISSYFFPDSDGKIKINDIDFTINRISSSVTFNDISEAYVKVWKEEMDGTKTCILCLEAFDKIDEFNENNGIISFSQAVFTYTGNSTDRYYAEAYLPDIPPLTPPYCSELKAAASGNFNWLDPTIIKNTSIGGGLRISSQEAFEANGVRTSMTKYNYADNNGTYSSGKMMAPLSYISYRGFVDKGFSCIESQIYITTNYNAFSFSMSSNSYSPIAYDASGALVGYSRVELLQLDNSDNSINGSTIYFYKNNPSVIGGYGFNIPNLPYNNNGLVDSVIYTNNVNQEVKNTIYDYQLIKNELSFGAIVRDNYIGPDICNPCGGFENPFKYHGRWQVLYYPIHSAIYRNSKVTEIDYFPESNNTMVYEKIMGYNTFGQLTDISERQSDGKLLRKKIYYPHEKGLQSMINLNFLNPVIQEEQFSVENNISTKVYDMYQHYTSFNNSSSGISFLPSFVKQFYSDANSFVLHNYQYDPLSLQLILLY